ncbi:MAG: SCP2 sterol-binding domain-containing protein [Gammaproteobacteria bacterium]|nr:SCP2 sterol-binding domain-containing protein [Gammaproteobacteria bacterium]MCD8543079.1 SCP2 sterol-binding domain-containing protein [Gammaproteobacteria bacterium]
MRIQQPIKALEKAFNAYLSLDPENQASFTRLTGRTLGLHLKRPNVSIYFSFENDTVRLSTETPEHTDTDIYASLFQLIRLKFSRQPSLVNTQFYIKGDVDTAQRFHELIKQHSIDWEEHLSRIIGDVSAHKMRQLLKLPADSLKRNKEKLVADITEYCQEESRLLPSSEETQAFREDLEELCLRLDRLQARINIVKKYND